MNTADYLQLLRQYKESVSKKYGINKIYLETSEAGRLLYSVLGFSDMKDMMHLSFSK